MAVTQFGGAGDVQLLNNSGDPLNGGKVNFFAAGTSTAKNSYPTQADAVALTNPNANPVILNSAGRAEIWLSGTYKVRVDDSADVEIYTTDVIGEDDSATGSDPGHVNGLAVTLDSAGADLDHDVNVAAGEARDGADTVDIVLTAEITKRADAVWSVGDNNGGLDTGALAASTRYYIWLIKRTDTGVEDVLISLSTSAPTMPTNYDKKILIGLGDTNASSNWSWVADANRNVVLGTDGDVIPSTRLSDLALTMQVFS